MKNTHLEHPEDSVLLGKESVQQTINYLRNCKGSCSVKYDGAPAIVWGTCPFTGRFFVGTKSVFNKKKIKINYSHYDIEVNHGNVPKVASILHVCFDNLPRIKGIVQGDFIGFGGNDFYKPNTIEYIFDRIVNENVIIAAHTSYTSSTHLKDAVASFGVDEDLPSVNVKFLNTDAQFTSRRRRVDYILGLASVVSNFVKYPETKKEVDALKIAVNKCIKENRPVSDVLSGNLLLLFNLLTQAKLLIMKGITSFENVQCYIGDDQSDHEGYVHSNDHGVFKLVDRQVFSRQNFTLPKDW